MLHVTISTKVATISCMIDCKMLSVKKPESMRSSMSDVMFIEWVDRV